MILTRDDTVLCVNYDATKTFAPLVTPPDHAVLTGAVLRVHAAAAPLAHGVAHLLVLRRHRKYPALSTVSLASPTMHHGTETLGWDGTRWSWDELALGCGTSYELIRGRLDLGRLSTGTSYLGLVVLDPCLFILHFITIFYISKCIHNIEITLPSL